MDLISLLQSFNLSESESRVYLALIHKETASPAVIAVAAEVKRTTAYHALVTLQEKGFAHMVGAGKTMCFRASPPEQLETILERREVELQSLKKKVSKALPLFKTEENFSLGMPQVEVHRGLEGIKNLGNKIFSSRSREVLVLAPSFKAVAAVVDAVQVFHYMRKRQKSGFITKSIWVDLPEDTRLLKHEALRRETRLAPAELCPDNKTMVIITDKLVVVINLLPEIIGFAVYSFYYSQLMRGVWENVWKSSESISNLVSEQRKRKELPVGSSGIRSEI